MSRKESGKFDARDPVKDVSGRADDPRVVAARAAGSGQQTYAFHSGADAADFAARFTSDQLAPMAAPGGSHHVVVHASKVPTLEQAGYTVNKAEGAIMAAKHPKVKKLFAAISKTEAQEDGTVKVWGYASSGEVDSDGETVTPEAMKAALPDYMKFGAVREMHDATKAAGTAIEAEVHADGKTWFGAHVVDPVAVSKVNAGVYKGFSIGGKVLERDNMKKSTIKGIKLVEVSLVDRPANPDAVITVMKAQRTVEDDVEDLADILDEGEVTPGQLLALAKAAKDAKKEEPAAEDPPKAEEGAPPADDDEAKKKKAAEEEAAKSCTVGELRKGMYSVSSFASTLQSLAYLCSEAQYEADYEGDASKVPAALKAWIASGAEIFQAMAAEEVTELVACLTKAGKGGDLKKTSKGLDEVAVEALIQKALTPVTEALAASEAKVAEMSKRAAPGRAFLSAVSLSKAADSATQAEVQPEETLAEPGTHERASQEMKKALRTGKRLA